MSKQNTHSDSEKIKILLNQVEIFQKQYDIQNYEEANEHEKDVFIIDLKYWIKKIESAKTQKASNVSLKNTLISFTNTEIFQHETELETAEKISLALKEQLKLVEEIKSKWGLPRLRKDTILPLGSTTVREMLLLVAEQAPEIVKLSNEEQMKFVNEAIQKTAQLAKEKDPTLYSMDSNTLQSLTLQQIKENEEGYIWLMKMSQETLKAIENNSVHLPHKEKVKLQQQSVKIQIKLSEYRQWFAESNLQPPIINLNEQEESKPELSTAKVDVLTIKTKDSEGQGFDFVQGYIACVEQLKMSSPALEDLENASKQSKATWSRRLNDPLFLGNLKKELKKKQSNTFSKKAETKAQWLLIEQSIDEKISLLPQLKDALNKKTVQYNDGRKINPLDDLGDVYSESIR